MESKYCKELEPGFTPVTICEAARCLLCHDAPCSKSCPAGTDPGKFIRSVRFPQLQGRGGDDPRKQHSRRDLRARLPYGKILPAHLLALRHRQAH